VSRNRSIPVPGVTQQGSIPVKPSARQSAIAPVVVGGLTRPDPRLGAIRSAANKLELFRRCRNRWNCALLLF